MISSGKKKETGPEKGIYPAKVNRSPIKGSRAAGSEAIRRAGDLTPDAPVIAATEEEEVSIPDRFPQGSRGRQGREIKVKRPCKRPFRQSEIDQKKWVDLKSGKKPNKFRKRKDSKREALRSLQWWFGGRAHHISDAVHTEGDYRSAW